MNIMTSHAARTDALCAVEWREDAVDLALALIARLQRQTTLQVLR